MKKLLVATTMVVVTTLAPHMSGTALAAKNCPEGSHKGKGPDPRMVCCYDNADPTQVVKIFPA